MDHPVYVNTVFETGGFLKGAMKELHIGRWVAEMDLEQEPRLYGDDVMCQILGVEPDTPPEQCYASWHERIFASHLHRVKDSAHEILRTGKSELVYPWMDRTGGLRYILSIGILDRSYQKGHRVCGYFQDVTSVVAEKVSETEHSVASEYLIQMLASGYEAVHLIDLRTRTIKPVKTIQPEAWRYRDMTVERYYAFMGEKFGPELVQWLQDCMAEQAVIDLQGRKTYYGTREARQVGTENWYCVSMCLDQSSNEVSFILAYRDINEREQTRSMIEQLRYISQTDGLTKVYNRVGIEERVNQYLSTNPDRPGALLLLDLDNFKMVNDQLGHTEGDFLLVETAEKLKQICRSSDEVGRLGGDEFLVLAKDVAEGYVTPLVSRIEEKFHGFAEEIVQKLEKDYQLKNGVLKVTASIGVAVFPKDGTTFADLYHRADIALYQAKRNGKNTYALYEGETE